MELSAIDSSRFGIPIGRALLATPEDAVAAVDDGRRAGAAMLILRVDVVEASSVHAVEAAGGRLCDTLVYYERHAGDAEQPEGVRSATAHDAEAVADVAALSFADYSGHYHADPRLDRGAAGAVYVDWARRSILDASIADRAWVALEAGHVVGFLTWRRSSADRGEIVLNAVHPSARRRGHYSRLLQTALAHTASAGIDTCMVSTHLANWPVQRAWARAGFRPLRGLHTFHLWLE